MRKAVAHLRAFALRLSALVGPRWARFIAAAMGVTGVGLVTGVAHATSYTESAIVTSVKALGTTGVNDLIPIILGVAVVGILLAVAIVGVRLVYKFLQSRRHSPA